MDKITIKGTYQPLDEFSDSMMIGDKTFTAWIENTAEVTEATFINVLKGAVCEPKWFDLTSNNYEEWFKTTGRAIVDKEVVDMLSKLVIVIPKDKEDKTIEPETVEAETVGIAENVETVVEAEVVKEPESHLVEDKEEEPKKRKSKKSSK